ncbi:DUF1918 domain-containing protein [Streptomyces gelaticus]|uniref:DUF1918 domain-containing protein n=1 Tax=Streptomyces gelaticus TaxID=285446 RepID=UPI0037AA400C
MWGRRQRGSVRDGRGTPPYDVRSSDTGGATLVFPGPAWRPTTSPTSKNGWPTRAWQPSSDWPAPWA